ncbi:hypothetical protein [Amaricoccus solimangrovi]|uniref:DUF1127 domain-containing protein n=1 Tax=Amaricoccus solimangrovi TaxID=2589815 RepID=A0A501WTI5_9RHOB|nr:hypothetical protein [Amaricoccus solimangrovi]TPE52679.1 hypothetical protein FJM51_05750 [Amaricoccus solimangrovi]
MYADTNALRAAPRRSLGDRLRSHLAARLAHFRARRDMDRLLAAEEHILRDIGIGRDEILYRRRLPFSEFIL